MFKVVSTNPNRVVALARSVQSRYAAPGSKILSSSPLPPLFPSSLTLVVRRTLLRVATVRPGLKHVTKIHGNALLDGSLRVDTFRMADSACLKSLLRPSRCLLCNQIMCGRRGTPALLPRSMRYDELTRRVSGSSFAVALLNQEVSSQALTKLLR